MPSFTVMERGFLNRAEEEWPSLGGVRTNPPTMTSATGAIADAAPVSSLTRNPPPTGSDNDNDWELLQQAEGEPSAIEELQYSCSCDVVVVDVNPKFLHHSSSSPDLRRWSLHDINDNDEDEDWEQGTRDAESSSYAMIEEPGSVASISCSSFHPSRISFRDAILARHPMPHRDDGGGQPPAPRSELRKPRARPRYVVRPIRRCTKSTGDLQSLAAVPEDDGDGTDPDRDVLGAADASDFYHRKALGAKGRANGLKIRPDELKRKQFALQRKEMQRRQGQR